MTKDKVESLVSEDVANNKVFPVSRETFYAQACEKPMTSLTKEYGVSSSYMAGVCTRF